MEEGLTVKGASVESCDYLLMESTYASPSTAFPPREKVREEMVKWVRKESELNTVILGGYSTGKAQELVAALNQAGIVPLVHPRIERVCTVYERFGVGLERVPLNSEEGEALKRGNFVGVMPFHMVNRELAYSVSRLCGKGVATALATGWASTFHYPVDRVFQLSDHADFGEMLDYLERARPGKVYCCYGEGEYLAKALRSRGYDASPFSEGAQRTLASEV
jgi:putative mRNA 3-end processing factor